MWSAKKKKKLAEQDDSQWLQIHEYEVGGSRGQIQQSTSHSRNIGAEVRERGSYGESKKPMTGIIIEERKTIEVVQVEINRTNVFIIRGLRENNIYKCTVYR